MALSERAGEKATAAEPASVDVAGWISRLTFDEMNEDVRRHARRSLLDLIGVAAGGRATKNSEIVCNHAANHSGPGNHGARILFDGRRVSVPGAAMAAAATIDSLDAHDGHRLTKGHAGVVILPALLAISDEMMPCTGSEFLTRFVIGYEIAVRAGIVLHESVEDYHTSGAWNAIGAAAVVARSLGLDKEQTRHAMGAAEYYAPRSQMMRCIDYPTMVKDGATYGAHAGVTSALLAADGFTGAPAVTIEDVLAEETWNDLGDTWRMCEQYLKPWPVCRWAQPAMQAALEIREKIAGKPIDRVIVETFEEASRLTPTHPEDTETAQYSLPFPLAAMLLYGKVDATTITEGLNDSKVHALAERVEFNISQSLNSAFPASRKARLIVILQDGEVVETHAMEANGDPERPLSDADVVNKFIEYAGPRIGKLQAVTIAEMVNKIETMTEAKPLLDA
ncbi:MAG TPA: MmgE/PrpD family protein, partial [Afifellaceae bacterium]|nr:MmgE/PrpD family protein [Afifellaceae bacterium]